MPSPSSPKTMSVNREPPLLIRALRGEATERVPVWLMRQAGRTDPAYLRLREEAGMSLEKLFLSPEWAARVTVLPARLGVDGLVLFQDILTPLAPLGFPFRFLPEPTSDCCTPENLRQLCHFPRVPEFPTALPHMEPLLRHVRQEAPSLPVIGFAGAPFTLLAFLAAGGSPWTEKGSRALPAFLRESPDLARKLLQILTDTVAAWLDWQIQCGVDVIQLFESAASIVSREVYLEWALPWQQQIFDRLRGRQVPMILFAHFASRSPAPEDLLAARANVYSLPATLSIRFFRDRAGSFVPVQGNLSNTLLAQAPWEKVVAATQDCLSQGGGIGHVFNLGHGLLRETPPDRVVQLIQLVKTFCPGCPDEPVS